MKALVHAEVLKLRTRTAGWLLLASLGLVALTVAFSLPKVGDSSAPVSLDDPSLLAAIVGISFGVPQELVVLVGGLAFTQEFRYGTVTSTYLGEPRRSRILVAKWLSLALASVVITLATLALSVTLCIALIGARDGDVALGQQFWQMVAATFLVMAAYGVIGVAVGALVRNQIVAVVVVLVWMNVVEQIVVPAVPVVGRWMPGGATWALLQLGPSLGLDGKLLSAPVGGLVLLGYTVAAVTLALLLTPRRDVL
jgi:ABC-2 type transport system permease protein